MPELLNHRHCKNCDRAVPYGDDELCSDECRTAWGEFKKKRSRTALFMYVVSAFLIVLLLTQILTAILAK